MTKLKTLKDFNIEDNEDANSFRNGHDTMHWIENYCYTEDLKQEAIKHIKAEYEKWNAKRVNSDKVNWIKYFFGIKEDDLK